LLSSFLVERNKKSPPHQKLNISCWLPLKITATDGILPPHRSAMEVAVVVVERVQSRTEESADGAQTWMAKSLGERRANSPSFLDSSVRPAPARVNWNVVCVCYSAVRKDGVSRVGESFPL
jgi:hypothetical protein